MLKNFFYWEIFLFTTTDWNWASFVIIGLLLGIFLRNFAVRRKSEFKDTLTGLVIIWFFLHVISYIVVTVGTPRFHILVMSMLSALAPVFTFALISFLLVHILKKVKDDE